MLQGLPAGVVEVKDCGTSLCSKHTSTLEGAAELLRRINIRPLSDSLVICLSSRQLMVVIHFSRRLLIDFLCQFRHNCFCSQLLMGFIYLFIQSCLCLIDKGGLTWF